MRASPRTRREAGRDTSGKPRQTMTSSYATVADVMVVTAQGEVSSAGGAAGGLLGEAPQSPAGQIAPEEAIRLSQPPLIDVPRKLQLLRFHQRQIEFVF